MTLVEMLRQQVAMKKRLVVQAERNLQEQLQELAAVERAVAYLTEEDKQK